MIIFGKKFIKKNDFSKPDFQGWQDLLKILLKLPDDFVFFEKDYQFGTFLLSMHFYTKLKNVHPLFLSSITN